MTVNERIVCKGNKAFTIIKELGSGGQGSVWLVKDADTNLQYAFKIINEKDPQKKKKKVENIRNLRLRQPTLQAQLEKRNFFVALPLFLYEKDGEFGYIMDLCKGKSINSMMLERQFDNMPTKKRLTIVRQIAESADWFRRNGLCYQDFSHKNFMYDDSGRGSVSVIDCDNVAPTSVSSAGDASFAGGTGFYAAPEIAFGQCKPSVESDAFALSSLLFKIMTGSTDSPYHGRELYTKSNGYMPNDMFEAAFFTKDDPAYGYDWLTFVFDPKNDVNRIDPYLYKKEEYQKRQNMVLKNWKEVPETMKNMFCRAFYNPLDKQARTKRPSPNEWMHIAQGDPKPKPNQSTAPRPAPPTPPVTSTLGQPRVVFLPSNYTEDIVCPFTLSPESSNFGISRKMGTIEKDGDKFVFRSLSPYLIKYYKGKEQGEVMSGKTVILEDGMELFFAARPSERARIILN